MAGLSSYIKYRGCSTSYTIESDLLKIFSGDHVAAGFIDILEDLILDQIVEYNDNGNGREIPRIWTDEIWAEGDLVAIVAGYMLGITDESGVRQRVDWLENQKVIRFCNFPMDGPNYGMYWIDCNLINQLIADGGSIKPLEQFLEERIAVEEASNGNVQ